MNHLISARVFHALILGTGWEVGEMCENIKSTIPGNLGEALRVDEGRHTSKERLLVYQEDSLNMNSCALLPPYQLNG